MYVQMYMYVHICMYMKQKILEYDILYIVISGKEKDFSVYVFLFCTLCEVSFNYVPMSLTMLCGWKGVHKCTQVPPTLCKNTI